MPKGVNSAQKPKYALVISSDSFWPASLESVLESLGFKVSRQAYIDKLPRLPPDSVVILDAETTSSREKWSEDIEEVTRHYPDNPVVVVWSAPSWEMVRIGFLAGASDVVSKSIDKAMWSYILSRLPRKGGFHNGEDKSTLSR